MIRAALEGMDLVELVCYDETIREGSGHAGMSAVLGTVARKRQRAIE